MIQQNVWRPNPPILSDVKRDGGWLDTNIVGLSATSVLNALDVE